MATLKKGSVAAGTKAPAKRVGPVDPQGAYTKVQKRTLASSKGKASLTKDKQLGATTMAKKGAKVAKAKDGKWIQKAVKTMRTDKPCTGPKFGSKTCPPGSKRYNLAKTFKKMAKKK